MLDLLELGVVDQIIWEKDSDLYNNCPETISDIRNFIIHSIADLSHLSHTVRSVTLFTLYLCFPATCARTTR